jgi:signal peptidase I
VAAAERQRPEIDRKMQEEITDQVSDGRVTPEEVSLPRQDVRARRRRRPENGWRSWTRDLVISVIVSVFIILFLYQPVRVEGTSMLPQLEDQDRLFINKFAYRIGEIHRGDVVVFRYPHDETKSYIKRVIALPGDDLRIDHGVVYVNGKPLRERYVPSWYRDDRSQPEMVLPEGEYFVMGDHRSISSDSRDFGPVPRDLIYGRAAFVYWPMDQAGVVH